MASRREPPPPQFQPGTRATFDGVVPKVMLGTTRLSEALKHTQKFQRLMDHEAPDSRAAAKRNRKAVEHLNKAVDAGSSIAAMNAAELCYNGSVCGIERDLPRAVHYYATIFERPVNALEELGEHLYLALSNFIGVSRDLGTIPDWLPDRVEAIAALAEWKGGSGSQQAAKLWGRRVRMAVWHIRAHLARLQNDIVHCVKCYKRSLKLEQRCRGDAMHEPASPDMRMKEGFLMMMQLGARFNLEKVKETSRLQELARVAHAAGNFAEVEAHMNAITTSSEANVEALSRAEHEAQAALAAQQPLLGISRGLDLDDGPSQRTVFHWVDKQSGEFRVGAAHVDERGEQTVAMLDAAAARGLPPQRHGLAAAACAACGKTEVDRSLLKTCPCKAVAYCSSACQKSHWKTHKPAHVEVTRRQQQQREAPPTKAKKKL